VDSNNPLNSDTTDTYAFGPDHADANTATDESSAGFSTVYETEHPAVLGARVGVCIFSSFVFPAALWAVGAATPGVACLVAALLTVLAARPVLLLGGHRVGRVVLLEIAFAMILLPRVLTPLAAIPAAVFFPLLGILATASLAARIAERAFAEHEHPHEVEAAVARAMQSNVVDIRSADAARRAGKKARGQTTATPVTQSLQSQI